MQYEIRIAYENAQMGWCWQKSKSGQITSHYNASWFLVFAACRAKAAMLVRHQKLHHNQVLKKKSQKYSLIMEDAKKYFDLNRFSDEEECDEDGSTTSISENSAPLENSVAKEGN